MIFIEIFRCWLLVLCVCKCCITPKTKLHIIVWRDVTTIMLSRRAVFHQRPPDRVQNAGTIFLLWKKNEKKIKIKLDDEMYATDQNCAPLWHTPTRAAVIHWLCATKEVNWIVCHLQINFSEAALVKSCNWESDSNFDQIS